MPLYKALCQLKMVLTVPLVLYPPPHGHLGHQGTALNYELKHPSTITDAICTAIANVMYDLTLQLQDGFEDLSELCSTPTLEHLCSILRDATLHAVDDQHLLLVNSVIISRLGLSREH